MQRSVVQHCHWSDTRTEVSCSQLNVKNIFATLIGADGRRNESIAYNFLKLILFSSQCLKWPPNFITSRQLAEHLGTGVWRVKTEQKTTEFSDSDNETKTSRIPWLKHKRVRSPAQADLYSLMQTFSGNSSTHNHAHELSSGKSECYTFCESWAIKNQV